MDYRPWTWRVPEDYKHSQSKMSRQDAYERVSGKAVYTRDIAFPGMLFAKILTSPYAHARITGIDTSEGARGGKGHTQIQRCGYRERQLDGTLV